jgi:hypothetical protein
MSDLVSTADVSTIEFESDPKNPLPEFDGTITIPSNYFYKMSKYDYGSPFEAVVREFFQNSVDANCQNFIIFFDDENQEIAFVDDGCGMDEDVIRNRLLVMGGTFKQSDNSIGSFGHAKILIYFSWENYEIITNNLKVTGKSNLYNIQSLSEDLTINGTASKIKVKDLDDYNRIKSSTKGYFKKCDTKVNVIMSMLKENGDIITEKLEQNLKVEMPLSEGFDAFTASIGNTFSGNDSDNGYVYVRTNGVHMFRSWVSILRVPIIIETKLSAREIFTQNRDSFKREYRNQFESLITRVNNDNISSVSSAYQSFIAGLDRKKNRRGREKKDRDAFEYSPNFYAWGKTRAEMNTYMKKTRSKRILLFVNKFISNFVTKFSFPNKVSAGFVFDKTVDGRMSQQGNHYILYVNPNTVEKFIGNKRKMVSKLVGIIKHELANSCTMHYDGHDYHNEGYVQWYHKIDDVFWDQKVTEKLFSECWHKFTN